MAKAKTNTTINGKEYFRLTRVIDGKRKQFYGTSKLDAERKYREFVEERQVKSKRITNSQTLGEAAEEYVSNVLLVSQKYAKGTIERYTSSYRTYIRTSPIAQMTLTDVAPMDVQKYYNSLDVSSQAIKSINKFMSAFCKWCVLMGYSNDFLSAVEIPKKPSNKRHEGIVIWDDDEIRTILSSMDVRGKPSERHRLAFFVLVLFYTGARISEAISLRYSDFRDDGIHIERQFYRGEMKEPKYHSSRVIPMHDELESAFNEHRKWHRMDMKNNHYKTDYVFTTSNGNLYDASNIRTALKRFYNSIGVEHKNVHAYRATFCTQLCRCGVPLEVASSLMGHKSMEVTGRFYAFVHQETKEDAIKKLTYKN